MTVTLDAVAAFGADAERIARHLPPGVEAVITDAPNVTAAYVEAVKRRVAGRRFYAMVLTDEPRLKVCNEVAKTILETIPSYDSQYAAMEQLGFGVVSVNGKPVSELWNVDENPWHVIHEFLALGEATLVRSVSEYTRQNRTTQRVPRSFRRFVCEAALPAFERRTPEHPTVVVWVGTTDPLYARLPLLALREFRGDVVYVSPQQIPGISHRWVHPDDPLLADVLARAGCAVCVDSSDPGAAIAFARRGIPTVAPETSGAHEYVFGSVYWNGSTGASLLQAVARALGSVVSIAVEPPEVPQLVRQPLKEPLPLVTVITMTYNRPELVRKVLSCVAAQTYPNVEHLVVNDGGTPLDDIVAEFPGARLISLAENVGTMRALKIGLDVARGDYISLLPDDDWFYPDHIERIMTAVLRTGATVAHTTTLLRFVKPGDNGTELTWGFNNSAYAMTATASQAQIGTPVAGHQVLQRREAFGPDDVGFFLLDTIVADQEYHMRLADRYPFVFVDQVTCEFRDHPANSGKQHNWSEAMQHIYEDVRPLPDRPILQAQRRSTVVTLKSVPVGENVNKPTIWWAKGLPPEAE